MRHRKLIRTTRGLRALVAGALFAGAVAGFAIGAGTGRTVDNPTVPAHLVPAPAGGLAPGAARPNVVFILTDDLSMNLLRFMPHVRDMQDRGMTFENYFVSDSLCCPSRSSIFTGEFPHNTHVFSNFGPGGGFRAFYEHGDQRHTFASALQRAGYVTGLMGKYLNGYMDVGGVATDGARTHVVRPTYVPPGWSDWDVAGWGYPELNYRMNENGTIREYGRNPDDYLTDVLTRRGVGFIDRASAERRPFFLELSTFAPHSPYVPAPRDAADFPGLKVPRPPSFNRLPTHSPRWLAGHPRLTNKQLARIDKVYRLRAQAVQSVDRMIQRVETALRDDGVAGNTYLVFSSDNGLHTGEYRLMPGKLTAFDTDIHVPLVVVGPGVPAGAKSHAMVENIDLAETFSQLAGTSIAGDGQSLVSLLHGRAPHGWRNAVLVEHHGPKLSDLDPDFQQPASGSPSTYEAMRTPGFLYVEYGDGERELYDLRRDPFELHNVASTLSRPERKLLHRELRTLERCHGSHACWAATHVAPLRSP
jgi:N-acetylglucosamine-6-sulfatase